MEIAFIYLVVIILIGLHAFCFAGLIKNEIVYRVRMRWIDEIYQSQVDGDKLLGWDNLPRYRDMFLDLKLWKYKPLSEYLKNKA